MVEANDKNNLDGKDEFDRHEAEINNKLSKISKSLESSHNLSKAIMMDPDVQSVIAAKQRGLKVNVDAKAEDAKDEKDPFSDLVNPSSESDDVSLEDLPRDKLVELIVAKTAKTLGPIVLGKLQPLAEKVDRIDESLLNAEKEKVDARVEELAKDNLYEGLKPHMAELHRKHPSMDIDELYVMAKALHGDKVSKDIETEKPDTSSARPFNRSKGDRRRESDEQAPGMQGAYDVLSNAVEDLDLDALEG